MAYPGLVLANAALGEGVETHLFFTFWGFEMINKKTDGRPEVHDARQYGHAHATGARRSAVDDRRWPPRRLKKSIAEVGVPEVPEFLEQIVASGGHLWACRMSADMNHLTIDDLYGEVEGIISAADFIEKTDGAQLLFI